jgi:hypothetical protein
MRRARLGARFFWQRTHRSEPRRRKFCQGNFFWARSHDDVARERSYDYIFCAARSLLARLHGAQQKDNHHRDSLKSWSNRSIVGPLAKRFFVCRWGSEGTRIDPRYKRGSRKRGRKSASLTFFVASKKFRSETNLFRGVLDRSPMSLPGRYGRQGPLRWSVIRYLRHPRGGARGGPSSIFTLDSDLSLGVRPRGVGLGQSRAPRSGRYDT